MSRGRPAELSREGVLTTALELVDREGLERFSMRGLGRALGVDPMAIYHYFPDKSALYDGLIERVYQEVPADAASGDWRADMRQAAADFRTTLLAHPHVVSLIATRPPVTSVAFELLEAGLEALAPAGFSAEDALDALDCMARLVIGHAITEAGAPVEADQDGREQEHVAAQQALGAGHFPLLVAAMRTGVEHDPDRLFRLALDGLMLELERRSAA